MVNNIIPIEIEGINGGIYSGFWSRLGANLLDMLILIPYVLILMFIISFNKYMYIFTVIPNLLFDFWYNVFLPKKYGGTPGKLIVGIKIIKIDSLPIGWKESVLRYILPLFLTLIRDTLMVIAAFLADGEIYNGLNWFQKAYYLTTSAKTGAIDIFNNVWVWSEIIVLLFSKRKRALHDFIAGTVVIKSKYEERIREKMNELNEMNLPAAERRGIRPHCE
jgi:uncharacterized RDD family membrane protein YckC